MSTAALKIVHGYITLEAPAGVPLSVLKAKVRAFMALMGRAPLMICKRARYEHRGDVTRWDYTWMSPSGVKATVSRLGLVFHDVDGETHVVDPIGVSDLVVEMS